MSVTLRNSRVVVLVKAIPNPSRKYGETVCCAGVTGEGTWKRLYPIRFRHLRDNKFKRWDWVKFEYGPPKSDTRPESCHVYEDRLTVDGVLPKKERASLLNSLISPSTNEAAARGMSLTLVRPASSQFRYHQKSAVDIHDERQGYRFAAQQISMLDKDLEALEPVPYDFEFLYEDAAGKHRMQCGDWETSAAYWNISRSQGERAALDHLSKTYNEEYPRKGVVFAMGTLKKRPGQWILLGVIRLDETQQESFDF
jgi:hypothetical protein